MIKFSDCPCLCFVVIPSSMPGMYPRYKTIEKRVGETPLEATERLREELELQKDVPMSYAGRLDPMAEGTLLILIGDECKKQKEYHSLDKEYEFTVLLGISSDTADVLGIVSECKSTIFDISNIQAAIRPLVGDITLPYPHFSAKTVGGKPLHTWALEEKLHEIEIPTKESTIYMLEVLRSKTIDGDALLTSVHSKIGHVTHVTEPRKALGRNFRRKEVIASWESMLIDKKREYQLITFSCRASSGTYMRTLAEKITENLGTCGLAYSIKRTTVGRYFSLFGKYGFFYRKY